MNEVHKDLLFLVVIIAMSAAALFLNTSVGGL